MRVFLICTHSVIGALPLGLIITSDEKTDTLVKAFEMYKDILPVNAFFNHGKKIGPEIFMTDNCSELRDALSISWPMSKQILCIFHILQQVWRWLHDTKNGIEKFDRPKLLAKFKQILYAETKELFEETFEQFLDEDILTEDYPQFSTYIQTVYQLKESWGLSFRTDLRSRGNNTNNNVEAQFLIVKDLILQRIKEYNINALFQKLTVDLNDYYKDKLLSAVSDSFDGYMEGGF